jgi:hypothetical protein
VVVVVVIVGRCGCHGRSVIVAAAAFVTFCRSQIMALYLRCALAFRALISFGPLLSFFRRQLLALAAGSGEPVLSSGTKTVLAALALGTVSLDAIVDAVCRHVNIRVPCLPEFACL